MIGPQIRDPYVSHQTPGRRSRGGSIFTSLSPAWVLDDLDVRLSESSTKYTYDFEVFVIRSNGTHGSWSLQRPVSITHFSDPKVSTEGYVPYNPTNEPRCNSPITKIPNRG